MAAIIVGVLCLGVVRGDHSDPEISDPSGDVQIVSPLLINVASPAIDITRVFFESNATEVQVYWEVVNLSQPTPGASGASYHVIYRDDRYTLADVNADRLSTGWRFLWSGFVTGQGEGEAHLLNGSVQGNVIEVRLPRAYVHGVMHEPIASSIELINNPVGGSGGPVWFRDRAPDTGHGRDFLPS